MLFRMQKQFEEINSNLRGDWYSYFKKGFEWLPIRNNSTKSLAEEAHAVFPGIQAFSVTVINGGTQLFGGFWFKMPPSYRSRGNVLINPCADSKLDSANYLLRLFYLIIIMPLPLSHVVGLFSKCRQYSTKIYSLVKFQELGILEFGYKFPTKQSNRRRQSIFHATMNRNG